MGRRFLFFGIGALISIIFLSLGPENRLKITFYDYIDYFSLDKRVIYHLENDSTTFSTKAECQLVYYSLSKEDISGFAHTACELISCLDRNITV